MMRLPPLGWRGPFFLAAFLFSLAALLPLRLALAELKLADKGLAAEAVAGSVWFGMLSDARFGPARLGDAAARLRFLPLLTGRARLDLVQPKEAGGLRTGLSVSRHAFSVDDASGRIDALAVSGLPPIALDLADVSVRFRDGLCASAEGSVRAHFSGELAGTPLATGFAGEARCDGPALLLPLVSQAGTERVELRLFGNGRYRADLSLRRGGVPIATRLEGAL